MVATRALARSRQRSQAGLEELHEAADGVGRYAISNFWHKRGEVIRREVSLDG